MGHSDEALIEKVRKIYSTQTEEELYFNDYLCICEIVKSEGARLGGLLDQKVKEIEQGKQCWEKVKTSMAEKEGLMKRIHEDLEETNSTMEIKSKELEEANSSVSELQLSIASEDTANEALAELKKNRDELEN